MTSLLASIPDPSGLLAALTALVAGDRTHGSVVALGLLGALIVVAPLVWWWRRQAVRRSHQVSPRRAFNAATGQLWNRLRQALPDHVVLIDAPLTRFVAVRRAGGLGSHQQRLDALRADFAICRSDGTVVVVLLIEDGERELGRRQVTLRRRVLERAGVRTLRWRLDALPTSDAIARELNPDPARHLALERGAAQRGLGAVGAA